MPPSNNAAVLPHAKSHPLQIHPALYPSAGPDQVIIKVSALAINPADHMVQSMGDDLFPSTYPYILGNDVAGTVVEVGSSVTAFKPGDRALALTIGSTPGEGGFQEYVCVKTNVVARIPDEVSFAQAAVLPLGFATAASGLYVPGYLELELPTVAAAEPMGKTVLIWAGASSVGSNAIQLARASGYDVFTTCSPRNFEYCTTLGAERVFDYRSPTVVEDLVAAFKGRTCAGGFAIFPGSEECVIDVMAEIEGEKVVVCAMAVAAEKKAREDVRVKEMFGGSLRTSELAGYLYHEFLPEALRTGKFRCVPEPLVVGHGLGSIQGAVDRLKEGGISAQKVVVTL
ncbi:chaperonin 10-like protein [Cercophora scortea]|uniref:Chaperonin 10-like protein n=1 Tax=Cercophora scortea TaxID=314031 RepID=A0AAE0IEM4_9PEZI|nr:chaperonin 10-like protein [Cercophora scortea]